MSLNPLVYLQLAILAVVFVGAALFVFVALARKSRGGGAPVVDPPTPRAALLASVSILDGGPASHTPQRFQFSSASAPHFSGGAVLNLHTQVDALLLERISEFLQRQAPLEPDGQPNAGIGESEGCVIVVADALPPAVAAQSGAPYLSGAGAVLSLARALAEAPDKPFRTLLIDTGSPAWSIYGIDDLDQQNGAIDSSETAAEPPARHAAPDAIPLPDDVRGVYDVIAGRLTLDECVLTEDELPRLMALAPGEMPLRWTDLLRSAGMRRLLAAARAIADVVLIYAPRVAEYPEQTRQLAEWSDGVIVISAELRRGTNRKERDQHRSLIEFELAATRVLEPEPHKLARLIVAPILLQPCSLPMLGRIALDFTSAPRNRRPPPKLSKTPHPIIEASPIPLLVQGGARGGPPSIPTAVDCTSFQPQPFVAIPVSSNHRQPRTIKRAQYASTFRRRILIMPAFLGFAGLAGIRPRRESS